MINCAALVLQPMFNNNIDQNNVKKKAFGQIYVIFRYFTVINIVY